MQPHQFWDSDIYKAVEAACYFLVRSPDDLETRAVVDEAVDMICAAQYPDGYINSYYTVRGIKNRWTNLRDDHELYCMGHLLEAVVAYESLTNNGRLLKVANKVCEHLDSMFGVEDGKKRGYPGHQEIEIGLLRLFEFTRDPLPLKLAKFFIDERGRRDAKDEIYYDHEAYARGADPYDFMASEHKAWYHGCRDYKYQQADEPLVQATEVKGHSVRAMYYYTSATDLVRLLSENDAQGVEIWSALQRLWRDLVDCKLYVTGAIGSDKQSEGFGPRYLLPDLAEEGCYGETCASFALINWSSRLLQQDLRAEYADVAEVALYNAFLGAMSAEGDAFYYQNALRTKGTGQPKERSKWFGVACCPPNVAKLLGNLGSALCSYDVKQNLIAIHQYIGASVELPECGNEIVIKSSLPWHGKSTVWVKNEAKLALRVPSWAEDWSCSLDGNLVNGYLHVNVPPSTTVEINFAVSIRKVYANPLTGKDEVCLMRGPLVYCFEDVDNSGIDLDAVQLLDQSVREGERLDILNAKGVATITADGRQLTCSKTRGLYVARPWEYEATTRPLTAIPYFLRANRGGSGAMRVWVPRDRATM